MSAAAAEETPAPPATASEPKLSAKGVRKVRQTERTLTCFLQALEGMRVVVELRQDTVIRGMLESADEEMNLVMTDATSTPLQGEKQELQWAYIKGHHIRYVHVPSRVDPSRAVEQNKRRIAQLRLIHNRDVGNLPSLPKGSP